MPLPPQPTESKEATPVAGLSGDLTAALARMAETFHASPSDLKAAFDALNKSKGAI